MLLVGVRTAWRDSDPLSYACVQTTLQSFFKSINSKENAFVPMADKDGRFMILMVLECEPVTYLAVYSLHPFTYPPRA